MEYIIEASPTIKKTEDLILNEIRNKLEHNVLLTPEERTIFLDYYIQLGRDILAKYLNVDITKDPLVNRCDLSQHIIGKLLEQVKNVLVFPKESQKAFYPTCKGHSFLICLIQGVPYLIDLTYRQFFLKENCSKDCFIYYNDMTLKTPDPGYFVLADETAKAIASRIISDGYIELTDEVAKKYGDSFYLTKTGDSPLCDISGAIYLNSLMKENYDYAVDDDRFLSMYGKVM